MKMNRVIAPPLCWTEQILEKTLFDSELDKH